MSAAPGAAVGLVLGGGGTVGLSYHVGALRALERVAGFAPDSAGLVVGTSAGAVVGAYLRSGWTTGDLWDLVAGGPSDVAGGRAASALDPAGVLAPMAADPLDLVRRCLGSALDLGRALVPAAAAPAAALARAWPGGLFALEEGRRRFAADLPARWPDKPLWVCALDLTAGARVVLGREGAPAVDLPDAVLASCSVPGIYPAVEVGGMSLVDAGARSGTNLDLAAEAGCSLVIGVAPMAFMGEDPAVPGPGTRAPAHLQLLRSVSSRRLAAECETVRRQGASVLLLCPSAAELALHGINFMRLTGWQDVVRASYEATARVVDTDRFRRALEQVA